MKFSIAFKYSNVTFKNKETKETIAYDTKASEGNTFTFDNVDEDVVIGMLKGLKDRKASQLFAYDDLRTNFINTMARNKCKELYDKLDKNEWKIEDIAVSNITIKDVEFTKPTMNAREAITVESRKPHKGNTIFIHWRWSSEYDSGESGTEKIKVDDISEENIKSKVEEFCNREWPEAGGHCDNVYVEVFVDFVPDSKPVFLFDGSFTYGKVKWYEDDGEEHICGGGIYVESISKKYTKGHYPTYVVKERLVDLIEGCPRENPMWADLVEILEKYYGEAELEQVMESRKAANESAEPVIFKKDRRNNEVIAFFPETMFDGSVNRGNIMSYAHNGQHGEASLEYFQSCKPCPEEEYADLLTELEGIYTDGLTVVKKADYGRGKNRRQMWPTRV